MKNIELIKCHQLLVVGIYKEVQFEA